MDIGLYLQDAINAKAQRQTERWVLETEQMTEEQFSTIYESGAAPRLKITLEDKNKYYAAARARIMTAVRDHIMGLL